MMTPIKPMLAVSGKPFTDRDWIFEPKIDGTRCIAHVCDGIVMLRNRRLVDITYRYPELAKSLAKGSDCVLDGEIAVLTGGSPDFSALAMREHQTRKMKIDYLSEAQLASYIVFDILYVRRNFVMNKSLSERKKVLREELEEDDIVTIIDSFPEKGEAYYKAAVKLGLEGIMGKKESSVYRPGVRSSEWIKIKRSLTVDMVVGGYIPGKGRRDSFFGGLLVGAYDQGNLVYVGRVGSGFSEKELDAVTSSFQPISKSPFSNTPSTPGVVWLKPEIVVEVTAMEVTHDGHLRAPVFIRVRDDKGPQDCLMEQIRASYKFLN
jgi:DNA ligase D-like protein (predicted ligase)